MLKHAKLSFILFISTILFTACQEEESITGFSVDKESIVIGAEGGTEYLQISSATEWVAIATEPWISISPANGVGSTKCSIVIDSTLVNDIRTATLRFSPLGDTPRTIAVSQLGFGKHITLKETEMAIASSAVNIDDRCFEVSLVTNVDFKVEATYEDGTVEWITQPKFEVNLDRGARPREMTLKFNWRMNTAFHERIARLEFLPKDESVQLAQPAVLTVTQEAAPTITDDRRGDSLAIVSIAEQLQLMGAWDKSENMQYWTNVQLWEATDEEIVSGAMPREAVGRVRKATFMMFYTKESIPQEVRYLKYAETLQFYGNVNTMLLSIDLGSEICELNYLKHLQIGAYGLVSLPDDFARLGKTLESLDINSNNFPEIPAVLTKENFPHLTYLNLIANRRWSCYDLRNRDTYEDGIGLYFNVSEDASLKRLFLWDTLEELRLSNNYMEGTLPDFTVGEDGVEAWTEADVAAFGGDTIKNLVGRPKVMPRMKLLSINLNFFTGSAPDWLLYHPHLLDWFPESLIFPQKENGIDSNGKLVHFDNEPKNFDYYYDFFPGYREKYEMKEEHE